MAIHDEARPGVALDALTTAGDARLDPQGKAAAIAKAGSSRRERLAGSAVGFGGGGPDSAGVYTSAGREGMAVDELLNDGQEEVFSPTEAEGAHRAQYVRRTAHDAGPAKVDGVAPPLPDQPRVEAAVDRSSPSAFMPAQKP